MREEGKICFDCAHCPVCQFKEQFQNAKKAVDSVMVPVVKEGSLIKLSDITWIKPVELTCVHFSKAKPTVKGEI